MATTNFKVSVYTPNRVLVKEFPAESLLIPTVRGQINLLRDHTHIVSRLETGTLSMFGGADDPDRHFSVTTGICKVLQDSVIILSNAAEEQHEVDKDRAERALKNAQGVLAGSESLDDETFEKYSRKVERAKLRIQLATEKK
jgi:F-type H+-transporting ATPase subunit epsilon